MNNLLEAFLTPAAQQLVGAELAKVAGRGWGEVRLVIEDGRVAFVQSTVSIDVRSESSSAAKNHGR